MTSVVLVDTGGTVVEYVTAEEDLQQEGECEVDLDLEGEVEGECEAQEADEEVVQEREEADDYPAVIVEEVPGASLAGDQGYSAQVVVYEDEAYLMQEVGDEQEVETEGEAVEASVHGTSIHCSDKTFEAAEALLRMDSPSSHREDRSPEAFIPPCITTPDFLHAAMRPDMIAETEVEITTEDCCEEEDEDIGTLIEEPEHGHGPVRKRRAGRKPKTHQTSISNGSSDLGIKKKPREGKAGSTTYLWEFLLDLLQDKNTCPRYIKWTQREKGIFKLVDSKAVSKLWGKHKNKPDMNYETMGRALRYYYQRGILAKVEGQRLVYQFKEMPKNIVIIDDDKVDLPTSDDLISSETISYERVMPSPDMLASPKKPNILRGGNRANMVQAPIATDMKVAAGGGTAGVQRIVTVSTAPDGSQQSQTAIISNPQGPRTVRVAMQVPVVMATSLGQKISTVAVQQPAGATGAAGHTTLLTNTSAISAAANNANPQQKVMIQTIPTMVPATAENGDKITVQLAKIITIPAHQLAQCQLQTTGTHKSGVGATSGISLLGSPLTVRALAPVNVAHGTQVMRLTVPTQTQPQTLVVSQPGSGAGVVTVSTANQTVTAHPRIISGVINGSELMMGASTGGVTLEKLKAAGLQVQAVQVPIKMAVQQNPKTIQNIQSEPMDTEVVIKLETPDVSKGEEPEC
ncbi:ETS-related transcription factor Elf-2-like isoform X3 [Notolabrus celidotus]|uniref:ETS-related transcription factor Elf-2-like isoform X3 n=1 Tax=Notolabrus celidotus TaxID=1203425 RepID=UPI00148FCEEA|nr:ETS-related transcription factor Elf-2-like isoform X3 [Notolabrus celidotus]XP_034543747.1 ETS-related transcription factor Elf-2-like isoform X3 [Notolabrus celidotus]XP_034543748.1 ETS-related transcription factor Elf-2-like isoform X3 [Notolabrus celidotus]